MTIQIADLDEAFAIGDVRVELLEAKRQKVVVISAQGWVGFTEEPLDGLLMLTPRHARNLAEALLSQLDAQSL